MPVAAADDYIGKTVASKYLVEQMIGEGGMGKVYKATQIALDKPIVLKVLRQALLSDERTVRRFEREAKAASRLNHPNAITVIDYGRAEDGALYIAMEYVQGKDLHHILSREWPLPESRVIRLMSQVLSALADAHSASVIHRDLKPENIMVEQRRGEPDFVKVLDFGIAKIVDGTSDEGPALTRAGFVCGTPEYMSPEQARGAQLDHRSDLYAVGVIIYQLMTGMLPFDSDSAVGFATKHLTEPPPLPTKRRPEAKVSAAMERLIMKALSKSPDERPQTAEQFRAELLAIEKERRVGATAVRRGQNSAPSLAPVPRKATPPDQQETKLLVTETPASPWAGAETTVKSTGRGPVPADDPMAMTTPNPAPTNKSLVREGGAALIFKIATVLLVLLAVSLAAVYAWQLSRQAREVYVPPTSDGTSKPTVATGERAWELQVAPADRRLADAARAREEGDSLMLQGRIEQARVSFLRAWQFDTSPEVALKLGELAWQQDKLEEASGWWARYRKDSASDAKPLEYLERIKQVEAK